MKNETSERKKSNKIVKVVAIVAVILILLNYYGISEKIVLSIKENAQKALTAVFNTQEELEINREDTPKINVEIIGTERANVTLNYDSNISEMQYKIEGENEDWQEYKNTFTVKENAIIQTRYKKQGDTEYTIGSSKVITDIEYNITLETPEVIVSQKTVSGVEKATIELNSQDEQDKTIIYEISVTRYSLNENGLLNQDGTINETAVSNMTSVSYSKLGESTDEIYTKTGDKNIEITKSGIYKIKVRTTTNGGFIKSEEIEKYIKIDNVVKNSILSFKQVTANKEYQFDVQENNVYVGSCSALDTNAKDSVKVSLENISNEEDIIFGNNIITYLNKETGNEITLNSSTTSPIETLSEEGLHERVLKLKIGATTISYTYKIKIGHTPGEEATCTSSQCCLDCGKILVASSGNHIAGAIATCSTNQVCTACGEVLVYAYGHDTSGGEVVDTEPTCYSLGSGHYICSVCGLSSEKTYSIATVDHSYTSVIASADQCISCVWYDGVNCLAVTSHSEEADSYR